MVSNWTTAKHYFPQICTRNGKVLVWWTLVHDDVMPQELFPHYWHFVRGIHQFPFTKDLGLALLMLSWDKNWDSHSLVNGYPSFYPRIALVAPSPEMQSFDDIFNVTLNELLNKLSHCQWFDTPWCSCGVTVMTSWQGMPWINVLNTCGFYAFSIDEGIIMLTLWASKRKGNYFGTTYWKHLSNGDIWNIKETFFITVTTLGPFHINWDFNLSVNKLTMKKKWVNIFYLDTTSWSSWIEWLHLKTIYDVTEVALKEKYHQCY